MVKLGKAFSDNVVQFSKKRRQNGPKLTGWGARITLLYMLLIVGWFGLVVRLFHLTVVEGKENRELSEGNRVRTAIIHAPRGILRDRMGKPLVENVPGFRATGSCQKNLPCQTKFLTQSKWESLPPASKEDAFLERDFLRQYLYPLETAHVLGYLSEINADEIANPYYLYQDYLIGDRLGRMGLEATFEKKLRGVDGKELIEVDAENHRIRSLGKVDPLPGQDLTLALDLDLQRVAYQAMGESAGAVVVSKPKTGEILALVSTPAFNPNLIHQGLTTKDFQTLLESPEQPLFNRTVSGVYPPGSIFKLIVSTAGLESGKITKETQIEDIGILRIGEFSFANWYFTGYGKTEGQVDIFKAIARSNDIYFYNAGQLTGVETIAKWGKKFGLDQKTGIELPGEAEGVMPDPEWRKKVFGTDWYLGDTYHLAIGQGELQTTPLQVNLWTNAVASGGVLCEPTLLKVRSSQFRPKASTNGRWASGPDPPLADAVRSCTDLKIKKETIETVTEGMRRACSKGDDVGYQGTGWPLFDFTVMRETLDDAGGKGEKRSVPVACKTGTAEFGDPDNKTHAWFTAFAPLRQGFGGQAPNSENIATSTGEPEIVVTVLVEKGGEGSSVAGPIAKKILEEWFKR